MKNIKLKFLILYLIAFTLNSATDVYAFTLHVEQDYTASQFYNDPKTGGSALSLRVGSTSNTNEFVSFVKFNLSPLGNITADDIISATLRMYVTGGEESPNRSLVLFVPKHTPQNNTWVETDSKFFYFNPSHNIGGYTGFRFNKDRDIGRFLFSDVTNMLKATIDHTDGLEYLSLYFRSGTNKFDISFASKESGGNAMQVEVRLKSEKGRTGPKGEKGIPGLAGADGINGTKGDTGSQGLTGSRGLRGAKGDAGFQGETGLQGTKGAKGDAGFQGETGLQGTKGAKGDTGLQGATGSQGTQGTKGDTGLQGSTGLDGSQGTKGDTGSQGSTGLDGSQGDKGVKGNTGEQGLTGLQGQQGDTGEQGSTGLEGPQGDTGIKGDTGSQGVDGISGPKSIQVLTGVGIWNIPPEMAKIKVTVIGGGAGGSYMGGGGAGGTCIAFIENISTLPKVSFAVGAGGLNDTNGGQSDFGTYCSATGGKASAYLPNKYTSPDGGMGSSGKLNFAGSPGNPTRYRTGGNGGNSIFGGGGNGIYMGTGNPGRSSGAGGGGGVYLSRSPGGAGASGSIIIEEY